MKIRFFALMLGILFIASCGSKNKEEQSAKDSSKTAQDKKNAPIEMNYYYNDIARFIAGMPVSDTSSLKPLTEKSDWKTYAADMETNWANFQKNKLEVMKPWIEKELGNINKSTEIVFYPFSGPDFAYMYSFLPTANTYYMVALEPVGIIPEMSKIGNSMNSFFGALNSAIRDNLKLSFFITKSMKVQMNNEQIQGTIPVLLFYMARMNMHIQDIKPVTISKDGKQIVDESNALVSNKKFTNGVEISFIRPGENTISKLYYYSVSIRNDGFESMPQAETYLKSLPINMTTIVKSSSYCMHEDKYNRIREIVLSHSKHLIQDDSGVPFRFFNKPDWNFGYYGIYTRPIAAFSHFYQEDLKKSWPSNAQKLSFRFGYNEESNIFVATRKK